MNFYDINKIMCFLIDFSASARRALHVPSSVIKLIPARTSLKFIEPKKKYFFDVMTNYG